MPREKIVSKGNYVNGLVGRDESGYVTSSYWDTTVSKLAEPGFTNVDTYTAGLTTAEMYGGITAENFVGWNTSYWDFPTSGYPTLK